MTGCGPARHGVFDHRYYDAAEGRMKVNHSGRIRVPTVWHLLCGHRAVDHLAQRARLVSAVQGQRASIVSGMDAPHLEAGLVDRPRIRCPVARGSPGLRTGLLLEAGAADRSKS